jgi:hypothetical protein
MSAPNPECSGCQALQQRVAELEAKCRSPESARVLKTLSAGGCLRAEQQQRSPAMSTFHRRLQYTVVLGLIMPLEAA